MDVLLQIPQEIGEKLTSRSHDLSRYALEALAVEAYREDLLTAAEVQSLLGLETRFAVDELLKQAGAYLPYSEEDLSRDIATLRRHESS